MARASSPGLAVLLLLTACTTKEISRGVFDTPASVGVLPAEFGPFEEPIGFAASEVGGRIWPLALKQGRFLSDDKTASFLRATSLSTGAARVLTSVAAWSPGHERVDVFAGDAAFGQLLRIPYVVDYANGEPVERSQVSHTARFEDVDGSGDQATLVGISFPPGNAATETWTLTYDGELWWIEGSRSGPQDARPIAGTPFSVDDRAWYGEIRGTASPGDRIVLDVDTGVEELDVGGTPRSLAMSPDHLQIAAIVEGVDGASRLILITPEPFSFTEVTLPLGAAPARLEWDPSGTLLVSDGALAALYERAPDGTLFTHALPWPVLDVAPLFGEKRLAYVSVDPANHEGQSEIFLYDLDARVVVDIEPLTQAVDGMRFAAPVTGITAMQSPYLAPRRSELGVDRWIRSVAVSLASGRMQWMEEGTGCLVPDAFGPRTDFASNSALQVDFQSNDDSSGAPTLEPTAESGRHVIVNACTGIARAETWQLRYDAAQQGWRVRGAISGDQAALAYENRRYLSDRGEVSFVIRGGLNPTSDGTLISFSVLDGALTVTGDNNGDTRRDVDFDLPLDPVYFEFRAGPWDGGYRQVDVRPHVIVPVAGGDMFVRVKPQNATIEFVWE